MFDSVMVVGRGRVGTAVLERLRERGVRVDGHEPDLVLLSVPDAAIADVARGIGVGPPTASTSPGTLSRAASHPLERAGGPPEALIPLMRRVIENDFELTGPIERGDWATVDAHLEAIREHAPALEPMYRALADLT